MAEARGAGPAYDHGVRSLPEFRSRPRSLAAVAVVLALALVAGVVVTLAATPRLPPVTGVQLDRAVPDLPLVDASGQPTSLAAFHGRTVVLTPFLTLCHEVCPITTGAFIEMEQAVRQAGVGDKVVFVEATVDPGRDSPARLRAYARLTGVDWTLLTGSADQVARFWGFFGVGYQRQPIGSPAPIDWWTHQPETYDVGHTDGLFIIGPHGRERIATIGMANVGGKLNPTLAGMLDAQGLQNLHDPQASWTVQQALDDLGHVLGQRIPAPGA